MLLFVSVLLLIAFLLWNINQLFFVVGWPKGGWSWGWGWFHFDVVNIGKILVEQKFSIFTTTLISNLHGKSELQIEGANLTNILFLAARLTDAGSFINSSVSLPLEDCERSKTYPTLLPIIFFEHSNVWVLPITFFAANWKIRFLPALLIYARPYRHATLSAFHLGSYKLQILAQPITYDQRVYEIGAHCHHALLRYFFWFSSFLISTESSKYFKKLSSSRKSTIDVYFFLAMRRVSIASTSLACFMISLYLYKLV